MLDQGTGRDPVRPTGRDYCAFAVLLMLRRA